MYIYADDDCPPPPPVTMGWSWHATTKWLDTVFYRWSREFWVDCVLWAHAPPKDLRMMQICTLRPIWVSHTNCSHVGLKAQSLGAPCLWHMAWQRHKLRISSILSFVYVFIVANVGPDFLVGSTWSASWRCLLSVSITHKHTRTHSATYLELFPSFLLLTSCSLRGAGLLAVKSSFEQFR